MELIVAIIWYLNLMAPNTEYRVAEIESVAVSNPAVIQIAEDIEKSTDIWRQFKSGWEIKVDADIMEWWEEDTSCSYTLETIPGSVLYEASELYKKDKLTNDDGTTEEDEGEGEEESKGEETQTEKEK